MTIATPHPMYRQTLDILSDLVAFDTTSRNSNLSLIQYIQNKLDACGIKSDLVPNEEKTKANLVARIGAESSGGILLSGHTDVVPVDGQTWTFDPWTLTEADGRLYGRGTTDMKGFIACVLSQVPAWSAQNLTRPIHLVFSYDEEVGSQAICSALQLLNQRGVAPDLCIVGEPTDQTVAFAHKSRANVWASCHATGGHASKFNDPRITSANTLAVRLCDSFDRAGKEIGELLGDPQLLGAASLAVTSWEITNTSNVIPAKSKVQFDFRGAPGISEEKMLDVLNPHAHLVIDKYKREKTGLADITMKVQLRNRGFHCDDVEAINLGKQFTGTDIAGVVEYVCEATRYVEFGMPKTVICGPGNILQAHQPDEFIEPEQLGKCLEMMERITAYVTQPVSAARTPCPS